MTHVRALRGATTLDVDTPEQMAERVPAMVADLMERNALSTDAVVSAIFTSTSDLTCGHPATAVRVALGFDDVAMMGAVEVDVPGSVAQCVRVLLHVETDASRADLVHVYHHGAKALRPDLTDS